MEFVRENQAMIDDIAHQVDSYSRVGIHLANSCLLVVGVEQSKVRQAP